MKLYKLFKLTIIEFIRQPMYLLTTLVFPSMFFWFFGAPNAKDAAAALLLATSFAAFGALGVMLFQLGVQIAHERELSWSQYLRTLPVSPATVLLAKVFASLVLALFSILLVFVTARWTTPLSVGWAPLARGVFVLLCGSLAFASIGIVIGYSVRGSAAVPLGNLIYLPLSFAGGLWLPPQALPDFIQDISKYLPTRLYGQLAWDTVFERGVQAADALGLAAYGLTFFLIGIWLYKRNIR